MEDHKDEINSGENISEAENLSSETESAQETESNASAPSVSDDGEYHFIRPEQNLYEDAEFVPCGEDTEVPKYYVPSEKKPKDEKPKDKKAAPKSKKRFVKLACACLACALIGGAVGGVVSWKVLDNNNSTPKQRASPSPPAPAARLSAQIPAARTISTRSAANRQSVLPPRSRPPTGSVRRAPAQFPAQALSLPPTDI